jgi:Core-2/I-Branching enzyme
MDFSALLSDVKRTAASAAQGNSGNNSGNRDTTPHHQQHSRRHISNNSSNNNSSNNSSSNGYPPRKRQRQNHRGPRSVNERDMKRALSNLPPPLAVPSASACRDEQPFHIALLFITIDDLPYEHVWNEWTSQATDANVQISMLAHAKYPNQVKSELLRSKLLVHPPEKGRGTENAPPFYHSRSPDWGSIEITRVMLDLVHEGLQVGVKGRNEDARFSTDRYTLGASPTRPVDAFVFVSETCLPVASLKTFCATIVPNTSWVNYRNTPNNGYSRQLQFEKIHPCISDSRRYKADQWCLLSRGHATALMDVDRHLPSPLWHCFLDTKASDELYIPTCLSLTGVLTTQVKQKRITYCDWSESAKNPATFSNGKADLRRIVELSRKEGCLFARKFSPVAPQCTERTGDMTVEDWKEVILSAEENVEKK